MPKRPSFKPIETSDGWMISVPPSMSGQGKRERKFFEIEKDAETFAKKLRGQYDRGERGGIVDAGLARMAAEAAKEVAGSGNTILEAVKTFAEMVAMLKPYGITPMDACNAALAQHKATGTAESFRERYDRFVKDNENRWRDRYARDMLKIPRWVGEDFLATPCAGINAAAVESALRANGADSASTVLARKTRVLAVLHAAPKRPKRGPVKIMSPAQCGRMLRACRDRAEVQAVALLLFAGVRPDAQDGELGRLQWEHVETDHITVHPEISKTDSDRIIPITPRLRRLLRGHPAEGSVVPPNWHRRIQAIRAAAGIAGDQDIARHTFASNYLVEFGEDATKAAMGHTANSSTLFRHYRRAVRPSAAAKYFR